MKIEERCPGGKIIIQDAQGGIAIQSPYDAAFVAALKREIPYSGRSWSKPNWVIDKQYRRQLEELVNIFYGVSITIPNITTASLIETKVFTVEYVGVSKERTNGLPSPSALGFFDGGWSLVLPEDVLKSFFEMNGASDKDNYYDVLCVSQAATQDEIKRSFRRLAKQWHPDVCKEPGAEEIFKNLNAANDVLSDPIKRKKYNAALKYENDAGRSHDDYDSVVRDIYGYGYRSPLRCGMIVCDGTWKTGKFIVSSILSWSDITDLSGRTMTSFWSKDLERFIVEWV